MKKFEVLFVVAFGLAVTALPPVLVDFYPFSTFPMFSGNPQSLSLIQIQTDKGEFVPQAELSLHSLDFANPKAIFGAQPKHSILSESELVDDLQLKAQVEKFFIKYPNVKGLKINQTIFAPIRKSVDVKQSKSWNFER